MTTYIMNLKTKNHRMSRWLNNQLIANSWLLLVLDGKLRTVTV